MNNRHHGSDEATLAELGGRVARYRLNRNLTQAALAAEAGVSQRTVIRLEAGHSTQVLNLIRVLRALGLLDNLDALVPEPAISPIQQLELKGKQRQRASATTDRPTTGEPWTWGDGE